MNEIPRLRIPKPATAMPSQSSGGPHFALAGFQALSSPGASKALATPDAVAVGSGLNEVVPEPTPVLAPPVLAAPSAPVELAAVGLKKNYRKGPVEIPVLGGVD